jgi:hypothetical protein
VALRCFAWIRLRRESDILGITLSSVGREPLDIVTKDMVVDKGGVENLGTQCSTLTGGRRWSIVNVRREKSPRDRAYFKPYMEKSMPRRPRGDTFSSAQRRRNGKPDETFAGSRLLRSRVARSRCLPRPVGSSWGAGVGLHEHVEGLKCDGPGARATRAVKGRGKSLGPTTWDVRNNLRRHSLTHPTRKTLRRFRGGFAVEI